MNDRHDPFSPQNVDESIDRITALQRSSHIVSARGNTDPNEHLVQDLQRIYSPESRRYQRALQRVEDRLLERRIASRELHSTPTPLTSVKELSSFRSRNIQRGKIMEDTRSGWKRYGRSVSLLVAVLVLVVLVGGLMIIQYRSSQMATTGSKNGNTAITPTTGPKLTPTAPNTIGKVVYTSPGSTMGIQGIAWSYDSQRVATTDGMTMQIWDATTGKNKVTVQLPGTDEYPRNLSWSPNNQYIAVTTSQALRIVDGKSGAIVRSYTNTTARIQTPGAMSSRIGGSHFSTLLPASGGLGFTSVAWSPDGRSIAVSVSAGINGYIQIVNAENTTLDYTLTWDSNYNVNALSWSSDGQYLATNVFDTQGPASPVMWVWQLSNRTVVLQQSGGGNPGSFAFQPGTHNLAFDVLSATNTANIEVWDVVSKKILHTYTRGSTPSWSPDGKQLAYISYAQKKQNVVLVNASTGKVSHTYNAGQWNVSLLKWSPNGKYMLSIETKWTFHKNGTPSSDSDQETVARVWIAS